MGSLDEVRKQFQSWIQPQIKWMRKIWQVNNSGFDTKISQEHSGFQNTWSGLNDIELDVEILQKINNSGFDNVWSGLNDVEADVEKLQKINNSGLDTIHTDLLKKQREEISGFQKIWNINYSGLNDIESDIEKLQRINNSGLDSIHSDLQTKINQEASGFKEINKERMTGWFLISGTGQPLSGSLFSAGAYTLPVSLIDYTDKTFYWYSIDSSGTLTIQVRDPNSGWNDYDTQAFVSGSLIVYPMTALAEAVRLRNEVVMSGTVKAWYVARA